MSNRSSGRRRRGGRSGSSRGPHDGNRQQGRNSGNAHQLLDKYKNMARDAHQQGDRVMNEYYLQFADHYFRVLAEVNERKEEQKREQKSKQQTDDRGDDKPQKDKAAAKPKKDKANDKPSKKAGAGKSAAKPADGEELKISADALPGAIPVADASDAQVNGKSPTKKAPASRSRRKPSDGDGAAAEA